MSTAQVHRLLYIHPGSDQLGNYFPVACSCGWESKYGTSMVGALNTWGSHLVDVTYSRAIEIVEESHAHSDGDVHGDRNWFHRVLRDRLRPDSRDKAPRPPAPRHLTIRNPMEEK